MTMNATEKEALREAQEKEALREARERMKIWEALDVAMDLLYDVLIADHNGDLDKGHADFCKNIWEVFWNISLEATNRPVSINTIAQRFADRIAGHFGGAEAGYILKSLEGMVNVSRTKIPEGGTDE